ncbi:MAG: glycosyltransferase family 4 protein [Phycisphaerae bacterium]
MANTIIHIAPNLSCGAGDLGISLGGLLEASPAVGMDPVLITLDQGGSMAQGVEHLRASSPEVDRVLEGAQAMHLHGLDMGAAKQWSRRARRHGLPCVISPLGRWTDPADQARTPLAKLRARFGSNKWMARALAVTAINQAEADALRGALPTASVRRLPLGLDTDRYAASTAPADAVNPGDYPSPPVGRIALVLAPLDPGEGCAALLRAFAELGLATEGWGVVLAGPDRGGFGKVLEAGVRRKGGSDRVLITSAPDIATQTSWLRRASLLIAPAQRHRPPTSILQAAAMGVPVLATSLTAPPELAEALTLCSPERIDIKEALRGRLACSKAELAKSGQELRERCLQTCDWKVLVGQYAELYESARQPVNA